MFDASNIGVERQGGYVRTMARPRQRIFDLVGEGRDNSDGSSRQAELRGCLPGEPVTLQREPDNPYDPNAILVVSMRGIGLGHFNREDAAALAPALDAGQACAAIIHELRGGLPGYPNFGCRVCITWAGQQPISCVPLDESQTLFEADVDEYLGPWPPPTTTPAPALSTAQRSGCAIVLVAAGLPLLGVLNLFRPG